MLKQSTSTPRAIAPIFVEEALTCGRDAGIDTRRLISDLGLRDADLDALAPADFGRLWLELSVRMDDEFFGLGARPMRPGSTTLIGHAVRDAPTLNVALRRMLRFLRVVLDEPYGTLHSEGGLCRITLSETDGPRSAFAYRTFFLIVHGFTCWLARERIPVQHIAFPCDEPRETNDYGNFFGAPVEFNAAAATLAFETRYLPRPVNRRDSELKAFLRTTPESFLRGYFDVGDLKRTIVETCFDGPPGEWPDATEIAGRLNMSRTTLHRRLTAMGQSLSDLKDEVRRTRAAALLTRTDRTVAQIAEDVGYREESAFFRAFRRWYGVTPGDFRRGA